MNRIRLRQLPAFFLASVLLALPGYAHNLDTRSTNIAFANDFLATMTGRSVTESSQPLVRVGDSFWIYLKTTPGPGTGTGVGGYQTFYVPPGVRVVDAAYVTPDPSDPRGFRNIAMKGQSLIALGDGSGGSKTTPELIGYTLPGVNGLGLKFPPVNGAGVDAGTLAGVYGDTGVFFSTNPQTAFNSYGVPKPPTVGTLPMRNNSGDTVGEYWAANITNSQTQGVRGVMSLWDSYQLHAFGRADAAPIVDVGDGRGNAPWGMGSAVAGPQSGYAWDFDVSIYNSVYASTVGTAAVKHQAAMRAAIQIGPWERVQYPGSQIANDTSGLKSAVLGSVGVDASLMGIEISELATKDVTAVRFAIGQLELGRPEYAAVKVLVTSSILSPCVELSGDAFGGDAGGSFGGKDHLWRYFDPTVHSLTPCTFLQKSVSKALVAPGEVFYYTVTFANNGIVPLENISIVDVLPTGVTHVSATPTQTTSSGQTFTWNIGTMAPNSIVTITQYVKATGTGTLFNTATAYSGPNIIGVAQQSVEVGTRSVLVKSKSVTPSNVAPGGTVAYTLEVENNGTGPTGPPMVLKEFLPPGFTYSGFVSATLNGASISAPAITVNSSNTSQPIFTIPTLGIQPGKKLLITFNALVGAGVQPGTYWNQFGIDYEGKNLPPIPEAPVTVGGGQIGDFIWRDWNGDGVQDAGEEGLPGVTVGLYDATGTNLITSKVTGAAGSYLFTGLQPNTYVVKVISGVPAGYTQTGDPDALINAQHSVTLALDQVYLTADFGYQPGGTGVIGDLVFSDANGGGSSSGDTGIGSITVDLYEDTNGNGMIDAGDLLIKTASTNGSGGYSFTGLATGLSYIAKVDATDPQLTTFFSPNSFTTSTPAQVAVANLVGTFNAADFGFLANLPGSIGDTVFIDTNGNRVYNSGIDTPLANVSVTLFRDSNGDGVADGPALATASSDFAGQYLFTGLGPDTYLVVVNSSDPDVPSGMGALVSSYKAVLGAGVNFLTADFPFQRLINKTVDKASALVGEQLTFTLSPRYPGNESFSLLRVIDPLPTGTSYVAASANAGGTSGAYVPIAAAPGAEGNLTTAMTVSSNFVTTGSQVTVTLNVKNNTSLNTVAPSALEVKGGAYTIISGPTPASGNVPNGGAGVNFVWVVRLDSGGEFIFSADADQMISPFTSWPEASSASVLSAPNGGTNVVTWNLGTTVAGINGETLLSGTPGGFYSLTGSNSQTFSRYSVATNSWTGRTNFGSNVGSGGALASDGVTKLYALRGNATQTFQSYDSGTNAWTSLANTGTNVNVGGALNFMTVGGTKFVYALMGNGTVFQRYNITSGLWEARAATPAAIGDGGCLTNDGTYIYALRGNTLNDFYRYDPVANTWSAMTPITDTAQRGASLVFFNNTIYALRGKDNNRFYRYNIVANTWTRLVNLPGKVREGGAISTDGVTLYAQRGRASTGFYRYNIASNTWTTMTSAPSNIGAGGSLAYLPSSSQQSRDSSITVSSSLSTTGDQVEVRLRVASNLAVNSVAPTLTVSSTGGASAALSSAPASVNIAANGFTEFVYTATITASSTVGSVTFNGSATGAGPTVFPNASSASVLVTPALTFRGTVTSPLPASGLIKNTAIMAESGTTLSPQVSPTTVTATAASIGDFVWADTNANGTPDSGELGISGVSVRLYQADGVTLITTQVTDANGGYHFYNLNAGSYVVSYNLATAPAGYFPSTATTIPVTLAAADQFVTADFGLTVPPTGTGSIGDYVWIDKNNDGVQDVTETGIANVTIRLERSINGTFLQVASTVTDAAGAYLFSGLSAANYRVTVDTASLITSPYAAGTFSLASAMAPTYDVDGTATANVTLVTLATNSTVNSAVDFGYNWSGSIGDYVWWDDNINGLQDEALSRGINNVRVQLYFDIDGDGELSIINGDYEIKRAFTNVNGGYLFSNLPPGKYIVDVYEDSFVVDGERDVVPTTADNVVVNLGAGQALLTADFGYFLGARIEANLFYDANADGIRNLSETRLAGINVTLTGVDNFNNPVNDVRVSNGTGNVVFLIPEGTYTISYSTAEALATFPSLGTATTATSFNFTALAGEENSIVFEFGRDDSGSIGDTIFADIDGVTGAGQGPGLTDFGLPGLTVNLYLDQNGDGTLDFGGGDALLAVTSTNASGLYLFTGLANTAGNQKYMVRVVTSTLPTGYQTPVSSYPVGTVTATSSYSTTLLGSAAITNADFGYLPPAAVYYAVSGNIFDDNGASGGTRSDGTRNGSEPALANIGVTIDIDEDKNGTYEKSYLVTTDASGNYSFNAVLSGSNVRITVNTATLPSTAYVQTGDPNGAPLSTIWTITNQVANATNNNFGFVENRGSIAGTVVVGNGNGLAGVGEAPVAGVTVRLRYSGADGILGTADDVLSSTPTLLNGTYSFPNLLPGPYEITTDIPSQFLFLADADGLAANSINVTLGVGTIVTTRDFEYQSASISGVVSTDSNGDHAPGVGEPGISGVTVFIDTDNSGTYSPGEPTTTTDVDGAYSFSMLVAGSYNVRVLSSSLPAGSVASYDFDGIATLHLATVTLATNEQKTAVDFGYYALGAITGTVKADTDGDTDGDVGIDGVTVTLFDANDDQVAQTTTDGNGNYSFSDLAPGSYSVVETDPSGYVSVSSNTVPVTVLSGQTANADFVDAQVADLAIVKTVDNSTPNVGEDVVFNLAVTNNGPSDATGVKVTDILPDGYEYVTASPLPTSANTWLIGDLANAATTNITITAKVLATGTYLNTATVDGEQDDPTPDNNTDDEEPTPLRADLAILKTVDEPLPLVGDNVVFTIQVTNNGPADATGVEMTDLLPDGYEFVSSSETLNSGVWSIGNLANGASVQMTITAEVLASGTYLNTGRVAGEQDDPNPANNKDDAEASPNPRIDLAVVKTVNNGTPNIGSNVIFTIAVNNNGPSAATGVEMTDLLPDGYEFVSSSETLTNGVWTIGDLANGGSVQMTITATVLASGTYLNTATVDGEEEDSNPANNTDDATTDPTPQVDLAVVKTVDDSTPNVGSNVIFTIAVNNNGPSAATGVEMTDLLPDGYEFVSSSETLTNGVWTIGNLANGGSAQMTITATVLASGTYLNTASVDGEEEDTNPANNTDDATTTPTPQVDLAVVKTVDDSTPNVGMNVIFTIAVNNNGPSAATGVEMTDLLPDGYEFVSASETLTNGVWTIGDLANGGSVQMTITATVLASGTYLNTATVDGEEEDTNPANNTDDAETDPVKRGSIAGKVQADTNGDGTADGPIANVLLKLLDSSGAPVLDDLNVERTTVTDALGNYTFENVLVGSYQVAEVQPGGYGSLSDSDGGNPDLILNVVVAAGEANTGNDFLEFLQKCKDTWTGWQDYWTDKLDDGETDPHDNPDGDRYDNLTEYAFCLPPNNGVRKPFCLVESLGTPGGVDGIYTRTAGGPKDINFVLEHTSALTGVVTSGEYVIDVTDPTKVTLTNNGAGSEIIRLKDLESITGLSGAGFVRIRVELIDEVSEAIIDSSWTETLGWVETPFGISCQTYNNPFLRCATFTGTVDSVVGQDLVVTKSAGPTGLAADLLDPNISYYVEVVSGLHDGQRFDVVSVAGDKITLATETDPDLCSAEPPFNTSFTVPNLAGARISLRRHWSLDQSFPPSSFKGAASKGDADQVQLFTDGAWAIYWLLDEDANDAIAPRWVSAGNASNLDMGKTVLAPGQGMFFTNRGAAFTWLSFGEVRENSFVRPLATGSNLVGGGYPINQSATGPGSRGFNLADGFFGSLDFKTADSFFVWQPDAAPAARGVYDTYYLLSKTAAPSMLRWIKMGDASATERDTDPLLKRDRSVFLRTKDVHETYKIASPWTL